MSTPDPEAPKLDPKPWICTQCHDRFDHETVQHGPHLAVLKPRPEYSQAWKDYPNA